MMSFMTASIPIAVSTHSRGGTPSIPVMQLMHYSTISISVSSAIASEYLLFPIASTALLYLFSIFVAFARLSKVSRTLFASVYSPLLLDATARLYSMMGIMILILTKAAAAHSIAAAITMETSCIFHFKSSHAL